MKTLHRKRFEKMIRVLDEADAQHRAKGEPTYLQREYNHSCGTPACAFGHYAAATKRRYRINWFLVPELKSEDLEGIEAAEFEFGIDREDADDLFGPHGCNGARTAKQAAAYIRKFLKRKERENG